MEVEVEVEVKPELVLTVESETEAQAARDIKREPGQLGEVEVLLVPQHDYEECVLCSGRTDGAHDIHHLTSNGHITLCTYIGKVAKVNLERITHTNYVCAACFNLVNHIEYTELEFYTSRKKLLEIIARNKLLTDAYDEPESQSITYELIKVNDLKSKQRDSSDSDEPLALQAQDNKLNLKLAKPNRTESSDDDFYWKLDTKEDDMTNKATASRPKRSKRNVKVRNAADLCKVELKEQDDDEVKQPKKKSRKKVNKKINKDPSEKRGRKKQSCKSNAKQPTQCPECDKVLKPPQLKYHIAQVHKTIPHEFVCEMCGRGFMNKKACSEHVALHLGISDWKCEPCNKLFPNKKSFLRHDKIHNGVPKHQCDLCGKSFIHHSSYRKHLLFHSGVRNAECNICGMKFFMNSHLKNHMRIHDNKEKKFECEICGKKFSTRPCCAVSVRCQQALLLSPLPGQVLECNDNRQYMQVHLRTHDKVKSSNPEETTRKVSKWFRCMLCQEKFDRQFKMELHLVHDHNQVLKKGPPKPRLTWKKLQREKAAAAAAAANTIVNAIAMAMCANTDQNEAAPNNSEPADTGSPV